MRLRSLGLAALIASTACGGGGNAGPDAGTDSGTPPIDCGTETACGSQCVDLASDPDDCGVCGHGCQGGACEASTCQPVMLASGEDSPGRLAVSGGYLYWTSYNGGAVKRVPTGGGPVETLASGLASLTGIAATVDRVYWLGVLNGDAGVWAVPFDGGLPTRLVADRTSNSLVQVGERLYWGSTRDHALSSISLDGGALTSWATPAVPTDLATDGRFLYWGTSSNGGGVYRSRFDGGELARIAPADTVVRVAAGGNELAWVGGFLLNGTPLSYEDAAVYALPLDGDAGTRIASLTDQTYQTASGARNVTGGLTADAQFLYWTDLSAGAVLRSRWSDGAIELLAAGQDRAVGLTEDDATLYWSTFGLDGGGTLMKLAK